MDQRKLMDNANTVTDMAKTQNSVYEIVSDMSSRQDTLEERLTSLEDKLSSIQEQVDYLPEKISRYLTQLFEKTDPRKNFLHPDAAVGVHVPGATATGTVTSSQISNSMATSCLPCPSPSALQPPPQSQTSPASLTHSKSVPTGSGAYQWPPSPALPSVSSRTPKLIPETLSPTAPESS
ncbi:hypothetical protein RUM44_005776 [Polyplax serrata]|uniref:Uncharacterized protein n=1 Tax=Polyplax serrata TaxID=468196 RepID=A0ABR1AY42_POLSC